MSTTTSVVPVCECYRLPQQTLHVDGCPRIVALYKKHNLPLPERHRITVTRREGN